MMSQTAARRLLWALGDLLTSRDFITGWCFGVIFSMVVLVKILGVHG